MILGVTLATKTWEPFWAFETLPGFEAMPAAVEATAFATQSSTCPDPERQDEWYVFRVPMSSLPQGAAARWTTIQKAALRPRAVASTGLDPSGLNYTTDVTVVVGLVTSDVLCMTFALVPSVADVMKTVSLPQGATEAQLAPTRPLYKGATPSMQEVFHATNCVAEAIRAAVGKNYVKWSRAAVLADADMVLSKASTFAGVIHQSLSSSGDCRQFRGPELYDASEAV